MKRSRASLLSNVNDEAPDNSELEYLQETFSSKKTVSIDEQEKAILHNGISETLRSRDLQSVVV